MNPFNPNLVKPRWIVAALAVLLAVSVPILALRPTGNAIPEAPGLLVTSFSPSIVPAISFAQSQPPFSPDRLPFAAEGANAVGNEVATEAQSAPVPALVGIVTRVRSRSVALVRRANGETVMLAVGEISDGWQLSSIGRDRVLFIQGQEKHEVALDFSNKQSSNTMDAGTVPIPLPPPGSGPLGPDALAAAHAGQTGQ